MISALIFLCIRKLEQTAHLAVGVSSVVVMMAMHGENLLKKQTNTKFFYCSLGSKNLSMHRRHQRTNSHQSSSVLQTSNLSSNWLRTTYANCRFLYYVSLSKDSRNTILKAQLVRVKLTCVENQQNLEVWSIYLDLS